MPSDTVDLDLALSTLWNRAVEAVLGENAAPVDFVMDWDHFRREVNVSFKLNALQRYRDWLGTLRKRAREVIAVPAGSSEDPAAGSSDGRRISKRLRGPTDSEGGGAVIVDGVE